MEAGVDSRSEGDFEMTWGVMPEPVFALARVIAKKLHEAEASLEAANWLWTDEPKDLGPQMISWVAASQACVEAAMDLRSLITAYGHAFHEPRPTLARLAEAQGASSAGLVKRYGRFHVRAINELLSDDPDLDAISFPFKSITTLDLAGLSPRVDAKLMAVSDRSESGSKE